MIDWHTRKPREWLGTGSDSGNTAYRVYKMDGVWYAEAGGERIDKEGRYTKSAAIECCDSRDFVLRE